MLRPLVVISLFSATLAQAETPITAAEFERFVEGRTFTYAHSGNAPYGIEAYLPNRQVIWARYDDICTDGYWFAENDTDICFVYPHNDAPKCWVFYLENGNLRGDFISDPTPILYDVEPTDQAMPCQQPFLGA